MPDVAGYLASKGLALKSAGARNIHTACFLCGEDPAARGRLYVNVDPDAEIPGLFFCHKCGAKGSLASIKRHFGDAVKEYELDHQVRVEILVAATAYYQHLLTAFTEVLAYLQGPKRGLHVETIKAHQLGYAPMQFEYDAATDVTTTRWPRGLYSHLRSHDFTSKDILATGLCQDRDGKLVDALGGMIIIPYRSAGNVVALRGRTWPFTEDDFALWLGDPYSPFKSKYKTCAGSKARLFNTDACWNTDEVFVTEGEMDALVLEQQGHPAMGVPGAEAWQDAWDDYLTPLKRVWLIYDRDAAGEKGANKLVDRFGTKVRRVFLSEEGVKCDPTMYFAEQGHTGEEFQALLEAASKGGLLLTVRDAIDEFRVVQDEPGLKFGWDMLDIMIEPGLQAGQIMILLAKTGTGKSLLLFNMLHRVRMVPGQQKIKILLLSLEQTRGEWWDRARRIHRFYNLQSDEEEAAAWWEENILLVDSNRVTEAQLRQILEDFEYQMGEYPGLLAVDYLGYWARSFRGEPYERTSAATMALKAIAKEYRIPMIVPHQVSRSGIDGQEFGGDSARDSGVIEETADFLLTMWSPDNALGREEEEKTGQIHLRIAKSRHGGRGQLLSAQMAPISLAIVPDGDPHCALARQELPWKRNYRDTWEKAVFRHRTGVEGHLDDTDFLDNKLKGRGWD